MKNGVLLAVSISLTLVIGAGARGEEGGLGRDDNLSAKDLLNVIFKREKGKFFIHESEIIEEMKSEFHATPEDIAFISSIRAAKLASDGTDLFENPNKLLQLVLLYKEAREKWNGKPVIELKVSAIAMGVASGPSPDGEIEGKQVSIFYKKKTDTTAVNEEFYDFFSFYVASRFRKPVWVIDDFYQIEYAKKRFVMP